MRPTRVRWTMRWMMIVVAVVAVDFGMIRWAEELDRPNGLYLGLLPVTYFFATPLSLLTVTAVRAAIGLAKRGQAPSFAAGYLLVGGLASLCACLAASMHLHISLCLWLSAVLGSPLDYSATPLPYPIFQLPLVVALFVLPQIALALMGGALAFRRRLTIVLERRDTEVPLCF